HDIAAADEQSAGIDDNVERTAGRLDDEAVELPEILTGLIANLRVTIPIGTGKIVGVDVTQTCLWPISESFSGVGRFVDARLRDVGEFLIGVALLVQRLLKKLGCVVVVELTCPRPRTPVPGDLIVFDVLRGRDNCRVANVGRSLDADALGSSAQD